jgi:hypothetical protein
MPLYPPFEQGSFNSTKNRNEPKHSATISVPRKIIKKDTLCIRGVDNLFLMFRGLSNLIYLRNKN